VLAPAAGVLAVACGSATTGLGYGGAASSPAGAQPTTDPNAAVSVTVRSTQLGQILTDAQGRTLYLFQPDTASSSACGASCLQVWPALTTNTGTHAGPGATGSLLNTITRTDGMTQVTYNGHPLYYYVGDSRPGDTTGNNLNQFGGEWDVLSPAGTQVG